MRNDEAPLTAACTSAVTLIDTLLPATFETVWVVASEPKSPPAVVQA